LRQQTEQEKKSIKRKRKRGSTGTIKRRIDTVTTSTHDTGQPRRRQSASAMLKLLRILLVAGMGTLVVTEHCIRR
jgi:hypothetical protein